MARALVVEDEPHIRDLVTLHLSLNGIAADGAASGTDALSLARETPYDLVVLDLMLPGLDGLTVCRAIRRAPLNADVPILMLTARREEADKVLGLESGADDYLTKPFGVQEFIARVRALLRRPRASRLAETRHDLPASVDASPVTSAAVEPPDHRRTIAIAGIDIDPARHRVRVEGRDVELTAQEFELMYLLASHPGIVFSREALLRKIWGTETFVTDRSADALVKRLRRKIERDLAAPRYVLTVWGVGYKFTDV